MLSLLLQNACPRATKNRMAATHPSLKSSRASFFQAAALNFVLLQLLFFGLLCYLFGSLFQQTSRTHALNVLWVDYDGGVIGDALRDAYKSLESDGIPTVVEHPRDKFPSERELREAVCDTTYWAALYTAPGSSERLGHALSGAASPHNQSNVLFYIWNEARYRPFLTAPFSAPFRCSPMLPVSLMQLAIVLLHWLRSSLMIQLRCSPSRTLGLYRP